MAAQPPPTKRRKLIYTTTLLLLTITSTTILLIFSKSSVSPTSTANKIRNVQVAADNTNQGIPDWALNYARPLRATANVGKEVSLFWHIPKSGGTTVKKIYECLGQTLATAAGKNRRFVPDRNQIIVFRPHDNAGNYVNVDTSTRDGLLQAASKRLVPSGKVDLVFSTDVKFAVETLFDDRHPARLFVLFRHPIHRLVSKFYYMQTAVWERSYNVQWKGMTLLQWATHHNADNNSYVMKLSGKEYYQLKERDGREAKRTLRKRFVVGLTDEMEESIRRFNVVMGIDYAISSREDKVECMDTYFGGDQDKKENSNPHPEIKKGSPEWDVLYSKNELDVKLYEYAIELFHAQKDVIGDFTRQHLSHLEKKVNQLIEDVNGIYRQ